jgi:hypothetical protein
MEALPDAIWKPVALLLGSGLFSLLIYVIKIYMDKIDENLKAFRENLQMVNIKNAVQDEQIAHMDSRLTDLENDHYRK